MSFPLLILLTFFLVGRPQDFITPLASLRPALVLTIITLALTFSESRKSAINWAFRSKESKNYAFFYLMMVLSIPFAVYRRVAFEYTILVYLSNILYFYIFLINVDTVKKLKSVIFTICCSVLFYSAIGAIGGSQTTAADRMGFGAYDPNDLAFFLVSLFPLSILFMVRNEGFAKKVVGTTTVTISMIIILLTGSRAGFLGLLCFTAIFIKDSAGVRWSTKLLFIFIGIAIIAGYGYKLNTERYSFSNIGSDYNVTAEDGRLGIWKTGLLLIAKNPVTGVGVNCFGNAIGDQRAELGEIPKWQAPHNSYVQVAAETGLIGFFLFYSMITRSYRNLRLALRSDIKSANARELKAISTSVRLGFIASLIVAFFVTEAYMIVFTLFFALAAVIKHLSITDSDQSKAAYIIRKI